MEGYYISKEEELDHGVNKVYISHESKNTRGYFLFGGEYKKLKYFQDDEEVDQFKECDFEKLLEEYANKKNSKFQEPVDNEEKSCVETFTPYRITTITVTCDLVNQLTNTSVYIDLDLVFKKIKLDTELFSVKSFQGYRIFDCTDFYKHTKEKEKEKFIFNLTKKNKSVIYNQITLVFYPYFERDLGKSIKNKEKVNMKLFRNGSIQMTGARSFESVPLVENMFLNKMKEINYKEVVTLSKCSTFWIDPDEKIYNNSMVKCGFFQKDQRKKTGDPIVKIFLWVPVLKTYVGVKKIKENEKELFVEYKFNNDFKRYVFDSCVNFIGIQQIVWMDTFDTIKDIKIKTQPKTFETVQHIEYKMKIHETHFIYYTYEGKRVKWFIDDENACIIDKYGNKVGVIRLNNIPVTIPKQPKQNTENVNTVSSVFDTTIDDSNYKILNQKACMINSIFTTLFKKDKNDKIDLFRLKTILSEKGTKCIYDPGSGYIAINIKFYFPGQSFTEKFHPSELKTEIIKRNGVCDCSKIMCEYCIHNKKHETYCVKCEKQIKISGDLCQDCRNCKTCEHQENCIISKCAMCSCHCKPCDCNTVTILSFHSGSNILTGCQSNFQIDTVYHWFCDIIKSYF